MNNKKLPRAGRKNATTTPLNERTTGALAEYAALRDEIVKRIEIRHQLLVLALAAFGILLPLGVEKNIPEMLLIYPLLALFVAVEWMHVDVRIGNMGDYIKEHIEKKPSPAHDYPWWETYLETIRRKEHKTTEANKPESAARIVPGVLQPVSGVCKRAPRLIGDGCKHVLRGLAPRRLIAKATEISATGVLCLSELAAVFIAFCQINRSAQRAFMRIDQIVLFAFDFAAIGVTFCIIRCRRRKYDKETPPTLPHG